MILANFVAAHLLSDCGLPALLGISSCADDITRLGFPFVFLKQGGFIAQNDLNPLLLWLDLLIAVGVAVLSGFLLSRYAKRRELKPSLPG